MKQKAAIFLSILFFVLAGIHFYWALGGQWGLNSTLPTTIEGMKLIAPTALDSVVVGLGLMVFGFFYWIQSTLWTLRLPHWIRGIGQWLIPAIFLLRSIGDFRYIGFFKEVRSTDFAYMDTWLYSPLCLLIGVVGFLLIFERKKIHL